MASSTKTVLKAADVLLAWTRMWNGEVELAYEICSADFSIYFGKNHGGGVNPADDIRGPGQFVEFLRTYHAERPGIEFSNVRHLTGGPCSVSIWNVNLETGSGPVERGGIDTFIFAGDGRIERVWSVTGERHMVG